MRKTIEFQTSTNNTALSTRGKPGAYEDLVLSASFRNYRHRFESGKTKIRLLPALMNGTDWLLKVPALQHSNGRHTHPSALKDGAKSVFDLALEHMKAEYPIRLFSSANKTGFRLFPMPMSICWAVVEDANGVRLRLLLHSFYETKRDGANGLGNMIYNQVLRAGQQTGLPGHPLNVLDGTSLLVERVRGSDTKFPSYRVSLADDRGPLQPILDKISDVEYNTLCPLEETLLILEPEEEWRLLAKVVGDDLIAEIRPATELAKMDECSAPSSRSESLLAEKSFEFEGSRFRC